MEEKDVYKRLEENFNALEEAEKALKMLDEVEKALTEGEEE